MLSGFLDLPWWGHVLVTLVCTHITIVGVTVYLHRCQAHRALDLHPLVSHFFRLWLWLTTGMSTREWAAVHRKHHAKCDTQEDPHSPQTRGIRKVLWQGAELYRVEAANAETLRRYGAGTPDDWLEHHVYKRSYLGISITLVSNVLMFGPIGITMWAVQMVWIPFWAAGVVNGLGHYWGYRNFDCSDASTNLFPIGILIGGEEMHNNHHAFATSAKFSAKWYEFDIGWMYIRILQMLGLARAKKVIPTPRLGEAKLLADFNLLQAVITYRYDVMSHYVASLKGILQQEGAKLREVGGLRPDAKVLRRWARLGDGALAPLQREQIQHLLAHNPVLARAAELRGELVKLWARSNASKEQLLQQLQDWIRHAETSGIQPLQDFSLRLRRYAV